MTELFKKKCRLCGKEILAKKYATNIYCIECKKTEEYKIIFRNRQQKINKTVEEKYGVKNSFLRKDFDGGLKRDKTCLNKYGVKSPLQNKEIHDKVKQTNLEKYGYENAFEDVEKIRQSYINKFGVDNPNKVEKIRKKLENTNLKRYGFKNNLSRPEILAKGRKTRLDKYGYEHPFVVNYNFTKPHRTLKNAFDFANDYKTEQFIKIDGRAFSIDELDRKRRIVIFVDGDYWHGNPKKYNADNTIKGKKASDIWEYDRLVSYILRKNGYIVLRFWESDIYTKLDMCLYYIKNIICVSEKIQKMKNKKISNGDTQILHNKKFDEKILNKFKGKIKFIGG